MTNKIVLRSTEEFMQDYKPVYIPIMALFLDNSVSYATEAGNVKFNRLEAVGDLRSKMIGPKDTEMHQVSARESAKNFVKYFFGSQFRQSSLQDTRGYEDVVSQVLDEHNKQADEILMTGESQDSGTTVVNNGLFYSKDSNYVLKTSIEIAKATDGTHVADMYAQIVAAVESAQEIDGRIVVFLYGATATGKFNGLFGATSKPLSAVLAEAFPDVSFVKIPTAIVPAGNGFIVVNMDQVKLHYTILPAVYAQGVNEEMMYAWTNFLMGSNMLEVLAKGAITRQPVTFAA